ncbi:MAG: right-handed parallel beta-helix repeat-containing protein, partial [Candidatus Marinimicrobia bacterium]|nr:right-handed parallel beta-helix repeat-containing protein [Candidatus Neomarinimicrobiota bacterium]
MALNTSFIGVVNWTKDLMRDEKAPVKSGIGNSSDNKSDGYKIYVSASGRDSNDGSKVAPLATLEKARDLVISHSSEKEIEVILGDGIYYLDRPLAFSSDDFVNGNPMVTFRAENPHKAIISGGKLIHLKWTKYNSRIIQARVDEDSEIDQFYVNGKRQRMARYPNAVPWKNVFDTWNLSHQIVPDENADALNPNRVSRWQHPEGGYVHAMQSYLWGDMHWRIKGKTTGGKLDLEGGWQNNRPSEIHPTYRIVENIFEELDVPGEWFYNKATKTLYYYPPDDVLLEKAKTEIVLLTQLVELHGFDKQPVKNIHFDGLVFKHAARTFMENKEPLLRSDWTVFRRGAIFFDGAEDCSIRNSEFDQVGGNSIFINNYNKNIIIEGCYIHDSGANGIAFVGDPDAVRSPLFSYVPQNYNQIDLAAGPKTNNYPQECIVTDCLITRTGRDEKQTAGVQISMSYKIKVDHCSIYDIPRSGININEGTFGGHIIDHCDVFNTVLETGDHGSFNSWGRDRFWSPDIRETAAQVEKNLQLPYLDIIAPNTIRNSRWRCDHGWDIDLDDGSGSYRIYNNVLLAGGLKLREGYDRVVTNNIIINNSLHPHVWYPHSKDVFMHNIVCSFYKPILMDRAIAEGETWGQKIDSNFFFSSAASKAKYEIYGCDANSLDGDPQFIDAANGDFRVETKSPAFSIGFKNFPMDEFGVISPWLKKLAKQPEIPVVS